MGEKVSWLSSEESDMYIWERVPEIYQSWVMKLISSRSKQLKVKTWQMRDKLREHSLQDASGSKSSHCQTGSRTGPWVL